MKLSKEAKKISRQLFRESLVNGVVDAAKVQKVTDTIIKAKPRQYIGILQELARLIRLELAKRHAIIESAAELEGSEKTSITKAIRARYGADITTEYKVTPELLGGLRIQVGSNVVDASVRSRLDRLANDLAA